MEERNFTMSQIIFSLSTWLHTIATLLLIGHYLLLSLIYLPVLAKEEAGGIILSAISKRSRVWMYLSLAIFAITGIYLMLIDPNYLGFGDFGNTWGVIMLTKHILIGGMIVIGFWFNAIQRVGPMMSSNNNAEQAIARFSLYSKLMAALGMVILFLTALAQVE
jgi:uncharacterized membrane protein